MCQKVDSEACVTIIGPVFGEGRGWFNHEGWTVPCLRQDGTVPLLIILFIIRKWWHQHFPVLLSCWEQCSGDWFHHKCYTNKQKKAVNGRGAEQRVTEGWRGDQMDAFLLKRSLPRTQFAGNEDGKTHWQSVSLSASHRHRNSQHFSVPAHVRPKSTAVQPGLNSGRRFWSFGCSAYFHNRS